MPRTAKDNVICLLSCAVFFVVLCTLSACTAKNVAAPIETPQSASQLAEPPLLTATPTVIVERNTTTLTVTASTTATPSPAPSTPTSPTTPPTITVEDIEWHLEVASASLQEIDGAFVSQLWVVEMPEQEARQLVDFRSAATFAEGRVSWSHDGQFIAYSHYAGEDKVSISIVNVANSTVEQLGFTFPVDPFNTQNSSAINLSHDSWSLDDQWVQVTLSYFEPDSNFPVTQELLLSTVDGRVIELDEQIEFVAWSQSTPDQFLYIRHPKPEIGYPTVHVGQIDRDEPLVSILDLEEYSPGIRFNIDWSPDNERAIATSYDVGTRNTSVVLINLQHETWELLYEQQSHDELPFWSLDGKWIAIWHEDGLYLWEIDKTNQPSAKILLQTELVTLLGWLPDKNWLIYQADDVLYAVNPEMPDNPYEILNLNALGIKSEQRLQASVWLSSQP